MKTLYVNLTPYKSLHGGALIGIEMGEYVSTQLDLQQLVLKIKNNEEFELEIQFPDEVYSVTDSFLKGLLRVAYNTLGYDTFTARVKFFTNCEPLKKNLDKDIRRFIESLKRLN